MQTEPEPYNAQAERIKAIEEAQAITAFTKDGVQHPRIRYGDEKEDWGLNVVNCALIAVRGRDSITR